MIYVFLLGFGIDGLGIKSFDAAFKVGCFEVDELSVLLDPRIGYLPLKFVIAFVCELGIDFGVSLFQNSRQHDGKHILLDG